MCIRDRNFCHHDYTYHNIIVDDNDDVHVIDFDYCKREVRVYDISKDVYKRQEVSLWVSLF